MAINIFEPVGRIFGLSTTRKKERSVQQPSRADDAIKAIEGVDFSRQLESFINSQTLQQIHEASMTGLVPMEELRVLGNVVAAIKPKNTLEVGLASGSTTMTILACAGPQHRKHIALDPYQDVAYNKQSIHRIKKPVFIDA